MTMLRDFQHAARLYRDNAYALAPKNKFLYYVNFNISNLALATTARSIRNKYQAEINMLCKTVDLPQYSANVEVKNQYNRKKLVQTRIDYTPARITMHDDNLGVTTELLKAYYQYYYKDESHSGVSTAFQRNPYLDDGKFYGLEGGRPQPFFENIKLYQFSRQQFTEFTLVNPMIERWGHDTMDQTDGAGIVENSLEIAYEAVFYSAGDIDIDNPATFGTRRYDVVDSPLGGREYVNNSIADAWNRVSGSTPDLTNTGLNPSTTINPPPASPVVNNSSTTAATPATSPTANPASSPQTDSTEALFIGGDPFIEGVPLTSNQIAAVSVGISMGNTYPPAVLNAYNEQTGANQ